MKYYLLVQIRHFETNQPDKIDRIATLEDGLKEYEQAKKNKDNAGVYLTVILKEIDL